jgi:integrase
MRVRLKGLNCRRKRLADGSVVEYWYAWKAGPRLRGRPGDPEFVAAYATAVAAKRPTPAGTLLSLLQAYQSSADFLGLSDRTRLDYVRLIRLIEHDYADFPLAAVADRRARADFLQWRDKLAERSHRQADYAWTVLARVFSWAKHRGLITTNPCEKGGRVYRGSRVDSVWSSDEEESFLRNAAWSLRLAFLLALWTGQRQGDLLRLSWAAYDGEKIRLRQSKTGRPVVIPVGTPLKAALDAAAGSRKSPIILVTSAGRPWSPNGFRSSWRKACAKAGVAGVTFNDLRGTAVTRLAVAGCTEPEIATLTGHTLQQVRSILDAHYLHRDVALAENAILKLEARTKTPDRAPDRARMFPLPNAKA